MEGGERSGSFPEPCGDKIASSRSPVAGDSSCGWVGAVLVPTSQHLVVGSGLRKGVRGIGTSLLVLLPTSEVIGTFTLQGHSHLAVLANDARGSEFLRRCIIHKLQLALSSRDPAAGAGRK